MMMAMLRMVIIITVMIVAVMMMTAVEVMISFLAFHILRVAQFSKQPSLLFLRVTKERDKHPL